MKNIHTVIDISASSERIWEVLTDFASYPQWNPFIITASGVPTVGLKLVISVRQSPSSSMTFKPKVLISEPKQELRWRGSLLMPGIFDGEHSFRLETIGPQLVRFTQDEKFSGFLVPLLWGSMGAKTQKGFESMNNALKQRAEHG